MKEKMISILCSSVHGQIIACNIIESIQLNLINKKYVKRYLHTCLKYFYSGRYKTNNQVIGLFTKVGLGQLTKSNDFKFMCNVKGKNISIDSSYTTVMLYDVFRKRCMDSGVSTGYHCSNFGNKSVSYPQKNHKEWEPLNSTGRFCECTLKKGACIGGDEGLFWITNYKNFNSNKNADFVRDMLGLIRYKQNNRLVGLVLPGNLLENKKLE